MRWILLLLAVVVSRPMWCRCEACDGFGWIVSNCSWFDYPCLYCAGEARVWGDPVREIERAKTQADGRGVGR